MFTKIFNGIIVFNSIVVSNFYICVLYTRMFYTAYFIQNVKYRVVRLASMRNKMVDNNIKRKVAFTILYI